MNVLVVGSGAREHAIVWKLAQSPRVSTIWVAPGNAGIGQENKVNLVDIEVTDISGLTQFTKEKNIDLTVVGPELPLSLGIVDEFRAKGLLCLGPTKQASMLETSKIFAKAFMQRHNIPTARYAEFTDAKKASEYVKKHSFPQVIKADGLAAGKGVIIVNNQEEAERAISELLEHHHIIIEEFLEGFEISFIILTDGKTIIPLASAQDHKRRNDGDSGPNTGGMGACSPAPKITPELEKKIFESIIMPTLRGMEEEESIYEGFLFAGLMITKEGEPKALEFNCRLGDPETQALLMRLQTDFFDVCFHAAQKNLNQIILKWDARPAVSLVLAAASYPDNSIQNAIIEGITTELPTDTHIFHAGTRLLNQKIVAHGGRILCISAMGETLESARKSAYDLAKSIQWEGGVHYRTDIGLQSGKPAKTQSLSSKLSK